MAVTLTNGSNGGLFDRIGLLGGRLLDVHALMGASATARVLSGASLTTGFTTLDSAYGASPAQQKLLDTLFQSVTSQRSAQTGFYSALKTIAENTLIEMVHADTPLNAKTVAAAMAVLIQQMVASGDDVNASTVSVGAQANVGSPTGTPSIVVSAKHTDGRTREYLHAETIRFTVATDSYTGGTVDRESVTVTTPVAQSDMLAYDWPAGSGVSKSLTSIDPSQDATSGGNLLTNSDMESFTSNTPDKFAVLVGAAGTDILAGGSSEAFDSSSNCLRFTYDAGTPLSSIAQTFNSASGTTATLSPNTVYLVNAWMKRSSGLSGAGTVAIELVDGSNAIIADDQSANNTISQVAASLTTSYTAVKGAFVTPKTMPTTYKLRVRMSTAIADSGASVFIDNIVLTPGVELYTGGPWAAFCPGATSVVKGDAYTVAISNTWGAFQQLFQRFFDMRKLGLQLPSDSAAGETLADSLIE